MDLKQKLRELKYTYRTYGFTQVAREIFYYPVKGLIYDIKKIWDFIPVLRNSQDYDFTSLFAVMEKQFRRMGNRFDNGFTMSSPKRAKELKMCAALCRRILNDNYDELLRKKEDEKYGKNIWRSEPTDNPNLRSLIIEAERAKQGTPEYQEMMESNLKIFNYNKKCRERDIHFLFDTMKKKIQFWWN